MPALGQASGVSLRDAGEREVLASEGVLHLINDARARAPGARIGEEDLAAGLADPRRT